MTSIPVDRARHLVFSRLPPTGSRQNLSVLLEDLLIPGLSSLVVGIHSPYVDVEGAHTLSKGGSCLESLVLFLKVGTNCLFSEVYRAPATSGWPSMIGLYSQLHPTQAKSWIVCQSPNLAGLWIERPCNCISV
ncbi:hypothetical protein U1Q18_027067 [Sarracenia purpurea var. burkii]